MAGWVLVNLDLLDTVPEGGVDIMSTNTSGAEPEWASAVLSIPMMVAGILLELGADTEA